MFRAFPIAGFKGYERFPSMSRCDCGASVKCISRVRRATNTENLAGGIASSAKNPTLRYSLTSSRGPGSALIKLYSFSIKLAISMAAAAASAPLLPAFVPARSIACSIVSVVMTPKMIGTPVSSEELTVPLVVPEHT